MKPDIRSLPLAPSLLLAACAARQVPPTPPEWPLDHLKGVVMEDWDMHNELNLGVIPEWRVANCVREKVSESAAEVLISDSVDWDGGPTLDQSFDAVFPFSTKPINNRSYNGFFKAPREDFLMFVNLEDDPESYGLAITLVEKEGSHYISLSNNGFDGYPDLMVSSGDMHYTPEGQNQQWEDALWTIPAGETDLRLGENRDWQYNAYNLFGIWLRHIDENFCR